MIPKTSPEKAQPLRRLRRHHEKEARASTARRTSRNVALLGAGTTLASVGAATLGANAILGLIEIGLGLACFLTYELTD